MRWLFSEEAAVCAGNIIQVFCSVLFHFQCHSGKPWCWLTRQQNYNATELKQDGELGTERTRGECDKPLLRLMGRSTQDRGFCSRCRRSLISLPRGQNKETLISFPEKFPQYRGWGHELYPSKYTIVICETVVFILSISKLINSPVTKHDSGKEELHEVKIVFRACSSEGLAWTKDDI